MGNGRLIEMLRKINIIAASSSSWKYEVKEAYTDYDKGVTEGPAKGFWEYVGN